MTIRIYKILNTKNKKCYIDCSKNVERRFKDHQFNLIHNNHHSPKLQASYNKTKDKSVFKYEIIEETEEKILLEREQYYINLYDSFHNGYNCTSESINYKYVKKINNNQLRNKEYEKFMKFYGQHKNSIEIGSAFLSRLIEKHYKASVYKNTNNIIQWFLENYDPSIYKIRFSVNGNRQYFLLIGDMNGNEFVCYKWYKGKIYNSHYDTQLYRQHCGTVINENKHYIIDVPTLQK